MAAPLIQVLFLRDTRHGGPARQPHTVAGKLAAFIAAATSTIDIAIYDFRLSDPELASTVVTALVDAATAGKTVRIAYDAGKPATADAVTFARLAADPAPPGTAQWVTQHFAGTAVQTKGIAAPSGQLMHSKYIVRDAGEAGKTTAVWMGSTNFTDDAWTLQENNIVTIRSATVTSAYATDFEALWAAGSIKGTGLNDGGSGRVGQSELSWDFAPGDGKAIDAALAAAVTAAGERVVLAIMVLTSHLVLEALVEAIGRGVTVSGIYDSGQMGPIEKEWAKVPADASVVANWQTVKAKLIAKKSAPYTPTGVHDFMHNKVLIADQTLITGSYNFSANAEKNAENQIHVSSYDHLVGQYADYIGTISAEYS
jgi:phosphatidylserine/phosphatidylglycerophosphate/cardiolipin synthase-like enzyme